MSTPTPTRMPTLYIPHGAGPCFFMDWNPPDTWARTAAFLRGIPDSLPAAPTAILLVTAHWLAPQPSLGSAAQPGLLFDYHGFPPHTYELSYPAPGAPALARRAAALLTDAGFAPRLDDARGYDHGSFIPLKLAFPAADVPVLQMSLLRSLDAGEHLRLGQALAPLRDEGVLVVASGNIVHNLGLLNFRDPTPPAWATAFRDRVNGLIAAGDFAALADVESLPDNRLAVPTPEHYLPLLYAIALARTGDALDIFNDDVWSTLSMTSLAIGMPTQAGD